MTDLSNDEPQPGGASRTHNRATLPRRKYGSGSDELSIVGLGGIVLSKVDQDSADRIVAEAVEKGVCYFDVAPTYGEAELRLGPALAPYRKDVFLACKTTKRLREEAEAELNRSLERLRTDHVDLYQFHALNDLAKDVDVAFGKGGALEAFVQARKDGRARHLGFSAHSVEVAMVAMDRFDFDSVLLPVHFASFCAGNFGPQVIEKARSKGMAVLALKPLAHCARPSKGREERRAFPNCWYQPLSDPDQAALSLRFTLSQPVSAALPPGDESLFRLAVDIAMNYEPLTDQEQARIRDWAAETPPLFRYDEAENKSYVA